MLDNKQIQFAKHLEIRQHSMAVYSITPINNEQIISGSADGFCVMWNIETGEQEAFAVKSDHPVYSIHQFDNKFLSIGLNNGDLHIIDLEQKKEIKFFTQHKSAIFSQIYLPKQQKLITGDADGYIAVWDTTTWKLNLFFHVVTGKVRAFALNNDESLLAVGGQDGVIRLFETEFFNDTNHFYAHQDGVNSLAFSKQQNTILLSGGKDGYIRKWDVDNGEKLKAVPAHNYAVYSLNFDATGNYFASASRDKSIKIWDIETLSVIQKLDAKVGGHSHSVNQVIWNNENLITCGDDRRIIHWKK